MKKYKKIIALFVVSLFLTTSAIMAQATTPSDPPDGPGTGDDPIGGGAPISGGTIILITSAVAYISTKMFPIKRKEQKCSK